MSDRSRLIAVMGSDMKDRRVLRISEWAAPSLFVLGMLGGLWKFPRLLYESPLPNYIIGSLGILIAGFGIKRLSVANRKLYASVLLIYSDRVIFKNRLTKFSFPRVKDDQVALEIFGGPLRLMSLRVGSYKKTFRTLQMKPGFIQRAKEDGVRITHSPGKEWLIILACIAGFPLISFIMDSLQKSKIDFGLLALIGLVAIFLMRKKDLSNRPISVQNNTRHKQALKKLLFTRNSAEFAVCYLMMIVSVSIAVQPLSQVDRKIHGANTLLKEGRFAEANREFEMIESPERSERFKNNYAWFLAVVPDTNLRNPKKAIELAQQALQTSKTKRLQDTLACAHMANGEMEKALEIAKEEKLNKRISLFEKHALCTDPKIAFRSVASGG